MADFFNSLLALLAVQEAQAQGIQLDEAGGVGKIMGAVIGAFIMGVMNNGMSIMGVNIDWQQMIKGVVLLAAVFFDLYNKNRTA